MSHTLNTYQVEVPIIGYVYVTVCTENEEQASDEARIQADNAIATALDNEEIDCQMKLKIDEDELIKITDVELCSHIVEKD